MLWWDINRVDETIQHSRLNSTLTVPTKLQWLQLIFQFLISLPYIITLQNLHQKHQLGYHYDLRCYSTLQDQIDPKCHHRTSQAIQRPQPPVSQIRHQSSSRQMHSHNHQCIKQRLWVQYRYHIHPFLNSFRSSYLPGLDQHPIFLVCIG